MTTPLKLLHTADWHLGKYLGAFSRFDEQRAVLAEICTIADREDVDVVLVAGDLYDTANASNEAMELLYTTLKRLAFDKSRGKHRPVIAIAGNHDSPERVQAPDILAQHNGILLAGFPDTRFPTFSLESESGAAWSVHRSDKGFVELHLPNKPPLRLLLVPYCNELRLKKAFASDDAARAEQEMRELLRERWHVLAQTYCAEPANPPGVNVMLAHVFMMRRHSQALPERAEELVEQTEQLEAEQLEEPDGEKPILHVGGAQALYTDHLPSRLHYVALGHLHRRQTLAHVPCPVVYSSSPLQYSMSEAEQQKYVVIVEAEPHKPVTVRDVPLSAGKRLLRRTFESVPEAVQWLQEHPNTLVELTLITPTFLTAHQRRQIEQAHDGIVQLLPLVKHIPESPHTASVANTLSIIDLSESIERLFTRYFAAENGGQLPNDELLDLFNEVLAATPNQPQSFTESLTENAL